MLTMLTMPDYPENEQMNQPAEETPSEQREWEEELPPGSVAQFPVDISREEYIRFNQLVSETTGLLRIRRSQLWLVVVLLGVTVLSIVSDYLYYQSLDPVSVLMILFLMGGSALLNFAAPAHVRRSGERNYDFQHLSGHSFYGIVTVYNDRIEKRSNHHTVTLRYADSLCIEAQDMMVIMSPRQPSVVIPARCLRTADAEGLRRAVLNGIPYNRQRVTAAIVPTAQVPLAPPDEVTDEWDTEDVLCIEVNYTREEFVKMATESALHSFGKILPYISVFSLLIALMFGFLYSFGVALLSFALMVGGWGALQVLVPRSRAAGLFDRLPVGGARSIVCLSQTGIRVRMNGSPYGADSLRIAWPRVTRAIARPDRVEFYAGNTFLSIPKRCIEDFAALQVLVDSHFSGKSSRT